MQPLHKDKFIKSTRKGRRVKKCGFSSYKKSLMTINEDRALKKSIRQQFKRELKQTLSI